MQSEAQLRVHQVRVLHAKPAVLPVPPEERARREDTRVRVSALPVRLEAQPKAAAAHADGAPGEQGQRSGCGVGGGDGVVVVVVDNVQRVGHGSGSFAAAHQNQSATRRKVPTAAPTTGGRETTRCSRRRQQRGRSQPCAAGRQVAAERHVVRAVFRVPVRQSQPDTGEPPREGDASQEEVLPVHAVQLRDAHEGPVHQARQVPHDAHDQVRRLRLSHAVQMEPGPAQPEPRD